MLTAEYNHGYPAVLKNAMDWTFLEWPHKPVTFVGWGNVVARAIEQLRLVAVELEMAPLRHAVSILPDVMVRSRQAEDPVSVLDEPAPPRPTGRGSHLVGGGTGCRTSGQSSAPDAVTSATVSQRSGRS